jgi:hypothetical protein
MREIWHFRHQTIMAGYKRQGGFNRYVGRHARACPGHPPSFLPHGVDGRVKPGHDEYLDFG